MNDSLIKEGCNRLVEVRLAERRKQHMRSAGSP